MHFLAEIFGNLLQDFGALPDVRGLVRALPVILKRDRAGEPLTMEFGQHALHVGHTRAQDDILSLRALLAHIFEVQVQQAALILLEALNRIQAGADPVAGVAQQPMRLLCFSTIRMIVAGSQ